MTAAVQCFLGALLLWTTFVDQTAAAETGAEAWLRYSKLSPLEAKKFQRLPDRTTVLADSVVLRTAQQELERGVAQMLEMSLHSDVPSSAKNAIVL
jgi:alpha-glucuronidase